MKIITNDCVEAMREMKENSVDAIVTDPPYGLEFMGKDWDKLDAPDAGTLNKAADAGGFQDGAGGNPYSRGRVRHGKKASSMAMVAWHENWAKEALRVLKPGGHLLVFGGSRTYHSMAMGVELAGFEIRDQIQWVYGQGFPKSMNVGKAIDKAAGAEREVVGTKDSSATKGLDRRRHEHGTRTKNYSEGRESFDITAPATDAAKQWDGWGTAMKPAHEPLVWARKPLTVGTLDATMEETGNLIGAILCQLLSSASSAESLFESSLPAPREAPASAALIAAVLRGGQSDEWCEKMATFNSPETVSTCLSIARSWRTILGVHSDHESTFTTETEIELTTALRTLNSSLSKIIPASTIQAASSPVGELSDAQGAEKSSSDEAPNSTPTRPLTVAALATLHQTLTSASVAESGFTAAALVASSALSVATTNLVASLPNDVSPAHEPIVMARKPFKGTVAANVLEHGTAAINVDGCRVSLDDGANVDAVRNCKTEQDGNNVTLNVPGHSQPTYNREGRWPANVIHDGSDEVTEGLGNAARFFYCAKPSKKEKNAGLEAFEEKQTLGGGGLNSEELGGKFGSIKAPQKNSHPTVKPVALMAYLCRLVTPPGGTVLDPFAGSGTTGVAAVREGFEFIGIEREAEYAAIAEARIGYAAE